MSSQPVSSQPEPAVDPTTELPGEPPTDPAATPPARTLRMRTVVLGVVMLVIALLSILELATSVQIDLGAVLLALMIGCGVLLIAGARRE